MEYLTREFIAESREGLDRMERCLTRLEERPSDPHLVDEIFRSIHTIKGATGFLGFTRLEGLAHAGEHLLGAFRDGNLTVNSQHITLLLRLLDRVRRMLHVIEATGAEGERSQNQDDQDDLLLESLRHACSQTGKSSAQPTPPVEAGTVPAAALDGSLSEGESTSVRLDVEVLNEMMTLVGELVLTRNQILQSSHETSGFADLGRRLDSVTTRLRETVTQARMQPVGDLFQKYPRMVRDLAKSCGRIVRLECSGQEVGLDRSLLEAIKDPITHAVRNAVDHGIEPPGTRIRIGKPVSGVIRLHASQQGGSVMVEISDNGAGISVEKVRERALRHGLVSVDAAYAMSDAELLQMVFRPGFSTADAVTQVSGRGVGMDVVRSSVERCGGSVELESTPGVGTVIRLRVPLTLAIVPAVVVVSAGQIFAIPQGSLVEIVDVPFGTGNSMLDRMEFYDLRGETLPVLRLASRLCLDEPEGCQKNGVYVAVIQTDGARFGLMIDDLLAIEEIVVKPLSAVLRESGMFSGAAVLADGNFALVLDLSGIVLHAGMDLKMRPAEAMRTVKAVQEESHPFLLCDPGSADGSASRTAIPLHCVRRIESVPAEAITYRGGAPYLRHLDELLPLADDAGLLRGALKAGACVTVLLCNRNGWNDSEERIFGLVVERVFDVSQAPLLASDGCAPHRHAMVDGCPTPVPERFAAALVWPLPESLPASSGAMA